MASYIDKVNFYNEGGGLQKSVPIQDSATKKSLASLSNTVANLQKTVSDNAYRGVLIVGDSYGTGYLITGGTTTPYTRQITAALIGADYYSYTAVNGAGFVASETQTFLQALQSWVSSHSADVAKVTEVWVVGGENDKSSSSSNVQSAVNSFDSYVTSTFGATTKRNFICVGINSGVGEMKNILNINAFQKRYAGLKGWGVFDINEAFCANAYLADTVHPTQTGQDCIAAAVISILSGHGGGSRIYYKTSAGFNPGTGLGSGLSMSHVISGRMCTLTLTGQIAIPSSWNLTPLTLNIGTMSRHIPVDKLQFSGYISVPVITPSFATTTLAMPAVFSLDAKNDSTYTATLGCGMGYGYTFQDAAAPGKAVGTLGGNVSVYMESKTVDLLSGV